MRLQAAILFVALLAASCAVPEVVPFPGSKPKEKEYKDVVDYKEHNIPGIRYYYRAAISYADYLDLVFEEQERETPMGRHAHGFKSEDYYKQKKSEYLAEAEKNLRKMFEINLDYAKAHQVMGLIHFGREEYDKAEAEFREVLRISPLSDNAWVNMAHARWRAGDAEGARQAIAEALKINPESRSAIQLREAIENEEKKKAAEKAREGIPPFRPKLDRW